MGRFGNRRDREVVGVTVAVGTGSGKGAGGGIIEGTGEIAGAGDGGETVAAVSLGMNEFTLIVAGGGLSFP